jgi:hypothetical protein
MYEDTHYICWTIFIIENCFKRIFPVTTLTVCAILVVLNLVLIRRAAERRAVRLIMRALLYYFNVQAH